MVFQYRKAITIAFLLLLLFQAHAAMARSHYFSAMSDKPEVFVGMLQRYKNSSAKISSLHTQPVRGGILPHHLLADQLMVDFFEVLNLEPSPERIVLIGPDHFAKGINSVSVAPLPWKTPFGNLEPDIEAIRNIQKNLGLKEDIEVFSGEHSIGNIIPFIKYYFPKSRVVPIIIQKNTPAGTMKTLRHLLAEYSRDSKTLILLSMDFSHHQTSEEADRRDELSQKAILSFDYQGINNLDIDCPGGLWLLLGAMEDSGNMVVEIRQHSNAAKVLKRPAMEDVTSYHTIFFSQKSWPISSHP